jgi:hypothetical protein
MEPLHYKLVFSVADAGFKSWKFAAVGLILIFVGIFVLPIINRFKKPQPWSPAALGGFRMFFVGFAILWTIISFGTTFGDYLIGRSVMKDGKAQYVEGTVDHFVPMPEQGHADEYFDVKGVPFSYSDFVMTAGFNNTSSHGGPIHQGLPVHIWYRDVGNGRYNEILKLEVAEK